MSEKINLNGKLIPANQAIFTNNNRAFKYGDSLFETIRIFNGKIPFLSFHMNRLKKGMNILGMIIPDDFVNIILSEINQFIEKKDNWRIRLTIFRNDGGLYTPLNNEIQFLIEKERLDNSFFKLNEKGLSLGISKEKLLSNHIYSAIKTGNSIAYILAANERKNNNWDDILIQNNKGEIAEALSSNLFLIINNEIITPRLSSACVAGTMRQFLLNNKTIKIKERNINKEKLNQADAIFITNAIQGMKWVREIDGIHFSKHPLIEELLDVMNDYIQI